MQIAQRSVTDEAPPVLVMTGIVKHFTATLALDQVDFDVRRGEVHALLGQNGAGKSTLIKVLAGVYEADAGEIRIGGPARRKRARSSISFIHQDLGLVEWMSVAENVAIQTGYPRSPLGIISWRRVRDAAAAALAILGSDIDPDAPISALPAAERSLVGDLPGPRDQVGNPGPRRADRGPPRGRRRTAARGAAPAQDKRHRHRLCHAPARRGVPHRGPRDGAARRAPCSDRADCARRRRTRSCK